MMIININNYVWFSVECEELLRIEIEQLQKTIPKNIVTDQDLEKVSKEASVYRLTNLIKVKGTARKLAESMQTIKTVLGMKIQSEQNLVLIN